MALTDNPMSLVVTGNVTIGANLAATVPTKETYLLDTYEWYKQHIITVPAGVNVLKVYADVYHEGDGYVELDVYSVTGSKYWLSIFGYEDTAGAKYVGVTPNKSYTLSIAASSESGTESGTVQVSYSQSINQQTPNVTDY